jgi:hypothetical protein
MCDAMRGTKVCECIGGVFSTTISSKELDLFRMLFSTVALKCLKVESTSDLCLSRKSQLYLEKSSTNQR